MKKIIAANWKNNGSIKFVKDYLNFFLKNKNSNNELIENRDISVDSISIGDKVEISEFETLEGLDSKLLNEIVASGLNNLFYKETFLQNLSAVKSVYIVGLEGDVSGVGYVAEGAEKLQEAKIFFI